MRYWLEPHKTNSSALSKKEGETDFDNTEVGRTANPSLAKNGSSVFVNVTFCRPGSPPSTEMRSEWSTMAANLTVEEFFQAPTPPVVDQFMPTVGFIYCTVSFSNIVAVRLADIIHKSIVL